MSSVHGGINQFQLEGRSDYLDLSVNLNPYGPQAIPQLSTEEIATYPDPTSTVLRKTIAQNYGVTADHVVVGNGATEILWASARAFLEPGDTALIVQPGFSEFGAAVQKTGHRIIDFKVTERDNFILSTEALDQKLSSLKPKVLSFSNPNSPTGGYIEPTVISCLADLHPDCIFLLDESFLSLSHHHQKMGVQYPPNVLRVVSLTKDYAIAGIRLGFALGEASLMQRIASQIPPWNVNVMAQKVGEGLYEDKKFLERSRDFIFRDKVWLEAQFDIRRIRRLQSATVFIMFKEDTPLFVERLFHEHKIFIRSCASYGFADWYRIAVRPRTDMHRFFNAYDLIKGLA